MGNPVSCRNTGSPSDSLSAYGGTLVGGLHEAKQTTTSRKTKEFVHEGKYAAEVEVDLEYTDDSWSPTMSADVACKLETVMLALHRGDVAEAAKYGRVFELTAVNRSDV